MPTPNFQPLAATMMAYLQATLTTWQLRSLAQVYPQGSVTVHARRVKGQAPQVLIDTPEGRAVCSASGTVSWPEALAGLRINTPEGLAQLRWLMKQGEPSSKVA